MENCTIIIHQGYGDLFNSIGIINYYSNIYNSVTVLLIDNTRCIILNEIFRNKNNIKCIIPIYLNDSFLSKESSESSETCITCVCEYNKLYCPRVGRLSKCKIIDYSKYTGDIIKIGGFNNYNKWSNGLSQYYSFAHAFYGYQKLDQNIRFNFFKLYNNKDTENNTYETFINKYGKDYILIHEDIDRNILIDRNKIDKNKIKKNIPIINLNNISIYFVDYTKIILNSSEIHLIDSSWSVFIYLLSHTMCKNIPIYINETDTKRRGRTTNIYKNPTFNNWIFY
jgi:hypothetical protein